MSVNSILGESLRAHWPGHISIPTIVEMCSVAPRPSAARYKLERNGFARECENADCSLRRSHEHCQRLLLKRRRKKICFWLPHISLLHLFSLSLSLWLALLREENPKVNINLPWKKSHIDMIKSCRRRSLSVIKYFPSSFSFFIPAYLQWQRLLLQPNAQCIYSSRMNLDRIVVAEWWEPRALGNFVLDCRNWWAPSCAVVLLRWREVNARWTARGLCSYRRSSVRTVLWYWLSWFWSNHDRLVSHCSGHRCASSVALARNYSIGPCGRIPVLHDRSCQMEWKRSFDLRNGLVTEEVEQWPERLSECWEAGPNESTRRAASRSRSPELCSRVSPVVGALLSAGESPRARLSTEILAVDLVFRSLVKVSGSLLQREKANLISRCWKTSRRSSANWLLHGTMTLLG